MSLTRDGGKPNVVPAPYEPPKGPINNMKEGVRAGHVEPGYGMDGETLHDNSGEAEFTGSPGNHGTNHGNGGTQGRR